MWFAAALATIATLVLARAEKALVSHPIEIHFLSFKTSFCLRNGHCASSCLPHGIVSEHYGVVISHTGTLRPLQARAGRLCRRGTAPWTQRASCEELLDATAFLELCRRLMRWTNRNRDSSFRCGGRPPPRSAMSEERVGRVGGGHRGEVKSGERTRRGGDARGGRGGRRVFVYIESRLDGQSRGGFCPWRRRRRRQRRLRSLPPTLADAARQLWRCSH